MACPPTVTHGRRSGVVGEVQRFVMYRVVEGGAVSALGELARQRSVILRRVRTRILKEKDRKQRTHAADSHAWGKHTPLGPFTEPFAKPSSH